MSAATSSTEMVDYVPSPPRRESAEGGEVVGSVFNVVTQPADVALFLGSPQGASLYNDWANGIVTDAGVARMAGTLVLEAFQTQKVFSCDSAGLRPMDACSFLSLPAMRWVKDALKK